MPRPSALGEWSYEVIDTKLARETRGGTVLQLCLYSELLGVVQGELPEAMHVVSPGSAFEPESFRVQEFSAYYRLVKRRLEEKVDSEGGTPTYPDPVQHCDICRWWPLCDRRRRDDDHLCLVAGVSKLQTRELQRQGVWTLEALGSTALPLPFRPERGAAEGYERVREQARIQLEGRTAGTPVHEMLFPIEPSRGLARLPEPSPGDVFLDFEGDPFVPDGGIEYLFGWVSADDAMEAWYSCRWATSRVAERAAFEELIDFVVSRHEAMPELHVYHFAPYESAALKRLMGRYATREEEVDRLLRAEVLVDLHAVVRQSLRASVESYSIKALEPFYAFVRSVPLRRASSHLRSVESALELSSPESISTEDRAVVEAYNRDDCLSAQQLRDWLERMRAQLISSGEAIPRPEVRSGEAPEAVDERQRRVSDLAAVLTADVPQEPEDRSKEQQGQWLLVQLLDWYRREARAPWWEFFRLRDLSEEEMLEERAAISGLEFLGQVGGTERSPVHQYRYPRQDTGVREGDTVHLTTEERLGTVSGVDVIARTVDIKKPRAMAGVHPIAVFAFNFVNAGQLAGAIFRLGEWTAAHPLDADGPYRAARDLLLKRAPRLRNAGTAKVDDDEDVVAAARRIVMNLDHGVLPIQGPPGAGKTYTGGRMVCELVRAGKKVGVTAVSHKVIRKLLDEVVDAARQEKLDVAIVQKITGKVDENSVAVREARTNEEVLRALQDNEASVVGGTGWLWAREDMFESVDVLFVDEAGQMSLANVLAVAQAASNVVLLGDPQQLEQPSQGSHPEGTDVSALEHLLDGRRTITEGRGLFLSQTWRLHPDICQFTSDVFYEGRLRPRPGLEHQRLEGDTPFAGSGLWLVPVDHEGNQSSSPEEADTVVQLVRSLAEGGVSWVDADGEVNPVTLDDILIVTPYNAQVSDIGARLPGARTGTVDRFQGQEAPIVIVSMTTSSAQDAPRGMEFLYSLNRLNVATSRARCACILVASLRVFEPDCRTPREMRLASGFCRYVEMSRQPGR